MLNHFDRNPNGSSKSPFSVGSLETQILQTAANECIKKIFYRSNTTSPWWLKHVKQKRVSRFISDHMELNCIRFLFYQFIYLLVTYFYF